jgi:hypothetical protein
MLEIFSKRPMIILLSVLWGLGLATLFASVANSRNCIIVRGELPSDVEKMVFQYPDLKDKCYTYKSYITSCENEIYKTVPVINHSSQNM